MISFDIDWYGTYNRHSALCDYIELMAVRGLPVSRGGLPDIIRDSQWLALLRARIEDSDRGRPPEEPDDDDTNLTESLDLAATLATDATAVLAERAELLGAAYPFSVADTSLVLQYQGGDPTDSLYLAFLALTVAHASKLPGLQRAPTYVFEDSLTATMNAHGLATSCLGSTSRDENNFPATLKTSCGHVGMAVDETRAPYRVYANEEGSDTISNLWPSDPRVGGVQFIGQATIARSNEWKKKLHEPPLGHWEDWLMRSSEPFGFLAVPHHVQGGTLRYLVTADKRRDVVDRLRLASVTREILDDEREILAAVVGTDLVPLAA
jgi:hypothetical protein